MCMVLTRLALRICGNDILLQPSWLHRVTCLHLHLLVLLCKIRPEAAQPNPVIFILTE